MRVGIADDSRLFLEGLQIQLERLGLERCHRRAHR